MRARASTITVHLLVLGWPVPAFRRPGCLYDFARLCRSMFNRILPISCRGSGHGRIDETNADITSRPCPVAPVMFSLYIVGRQRIPDDL